MILIIDNGSQYTHLIKRSCRDLDFNAQILNAKANKTEFEKLLADKTDPLSHIILSGGPSSVYTDPPSLCSYICTLTKDNKLNLPILGICYGQQMIAHIFGAEVAKGKSAEYGFSQIFIDKEDALFSGLETHGKSFRAWASHFDEVKMLPTGFESLAHSEICKFEAIKHTTKNIFGVQFHPEVWHTENGEKIIQNFLKV